MPSMSKSPHVRRKKFVTSVSGEKLRFECSVVHGNPYVTSVGSLKLPGYHVDKYQDILTCGSFVSSSPTQENLLHKSCWVPFSGDSVLWIHGLTIFHKQWNFYSPIWSSIESPLGVKHTSMVVQLTYFLSSIHSKISIADVPAKLIVALMLTTGLDLEYNKN